jgi:AcrR family transcriptional regulator
MAQKEHIIARAAEMFVEQGIKSVRMDDIASTIGVSKRTLYEMFESKDELLYLAIRHMQRCKLEHIQSSLQSSRDSLAYLLDALALMLDNKEAHRRISHNLRKFYPATFERVRKEAEEENGRLLFSMIKHYIDCGLILPTVDIRLSVTILYYTATTLVVSAGNMSLPEGVSLEDALNYTIVNFFRGIATIEGVHQIDQYLQNKNNRD